MYNFLIKSKKGDKSIKHLIKDFIFLVMTLFVLNIFVEARINDKMMEYKIKKPEELTSTFKNIINFLIG